MDVIQIMAKMGNLTATFLHSYHAPFRNQYKNMKSMDDVPRPLVMPAEARMPKKLFTVNASLVGALIG